jgi:hypothetical protein
MLNNVPAKAIIIGAVDGVPSQPICKAVEECGFEVIFSINQYFV